MKRPYFGLNSAVYLFTPLGSEPTVIFPYVTGRLYVRSCHFAANSQDFFRRFQFNISVNKGEELIGYRGRLIFRRCSATLAGWTVWTFESFSDSFISSSFSAGRSYPRVQPTIPICLYDKEDKEHFIEDCTQSWCTLRNTYWRLRSLSKNVLLLITFLSGEAEGSLNFVYAFGYRESHFMLLSIFTSSISGK